MLKLRQEYYTLAMRIFTEFKKLSEILSKSVNIKITIFSAIIFAFFIVFILPYEAQKLENITGLNQSPDTQLFYSPEFLFKLAEEYGEAGRSHYIQSRFSFDLLWPIVYVGFLAFLLSLLQKNRTEKSILQYSNILPILAGFLDILENSAVSLLMYTFPDRILAVAYMAPVFTSSKWLLLALSFLCVCVLCFLRAADFLKNSKYRKPIVIVFIAIFALGLFSIYSTSEEDLVILIVHKDQSDTRSLNPTRLKVASDMALKQYQSGPKSLSIKHHTISYIGSEEEAYVLAKNYILKNKKIVALVGDINSSGTSFLAQLAQEFNIPHFSFFATDNSIFLNSPLSFSYRNLVDSEHFVLKEILEQEVSAENIIILSGDLSNIAQRATAFHAILDEHRQFNVIHSEIFDSSILDFSNLIYSLQQIEETFDTLVLFLRSNQIEHFLQQWIKTGLEKNILLSGVTLTIEGVNQLRSIDVPLYSFAPAMYLNYTGDTDSSFTEELQTFVEEYKVAVGYHRFDSLGAQIYDGFMLIYELLNKIDDYSTLRDELFVYDGERMIGMISFDQNGLFSSKTLLPVKVRNGSYYRVTKNE